MAFVTDERVRENSTTTGTGDFTLAGAVSGFKSFASRLSVNDTTWYCIVGGTEWEVGLGTYIALNTLTRTTVYRSSNSDNAVNFSAGTKDVFITLPGMSVPVVAGVAQSLTAAQQAQARSNISSILKGHIFGLTLSNNGTDATNDIDIAAGEAASTETNPVLMVLASALTKRLDASWAVGTGNGGLDTGSIANTTYHIWLIQRSDTGVVDALFSTSATSPTMPANYDRKRRIGSIVRASNAILAFTHNGDIFLLSTPQLVNSTAVNTSVVDLAFSVPAGITIEILANIYAINSNGSCVWVFYSPFIGGSIGLANTNLVSQSSSIGVSGQFRFLTNNANVKAVSNTATGGTVNHATIGWVDTRGRT